MAEKATGAKKKPAAKKPAAQFVGKEEFKAFQTETSTTLNTILGLLEKRQGETSESVNSDSTGNTENVVKPAEASTKDIGGPNGMLPLQYQKVFEKYFDPEDGFGASLTFPETDDRGNEIGGITFTISVPMALSNTDDGYRKMYKKDLRSRALLPHSISKGIEEWCKMVAKNLTYDRNMKRK